jgi:hypothetical protein
MIPVAQLPAVMKAFAASLSPSTTAVLPDVARLRGALANNPATWTQIVTTYGNWLANFYTPAVKADIAKLARREADIPGFQRFALPELDEEFRRKQREGHMDLRLSGNIDPASTRWNSGPMVFDILEGKAFAESILDNNTIPPMGSQDAAVNVLLKLRAFEGCLIRVAAAQQAAAATGKTLDIALALYRQEGNLVAPSATNTLTAALPLPPIESRFLYQLSIKGVSFIPNLTAGVWLMNRDDFDELFGVHDPDVVKAAALNDWFLVMIGFDMVMGALGADNTRDVGSLAAAFGAISGDYWGLAQQDASVDNAAQRYLNMLGNLHFEEKAVAGGSPVLCVTPDDPIQHAGMILTEGLSLFKAFANKVEFAPALAYIGYNSQAQWLLTDVMQQGGATQLQKIIVSGVEAAKRASNTRFPGLAASLANVTFPPRVDKDGGYFKAMESIDAHTTEIDWGQFSNFVLLANRTEWKFWQEFRANNLRFVQLVDYYSKAIA